MNGTISENLALLAAQHPAAGVTAIDTGWVHVGQYRRILAALLTGDAVAGDVDVKVEMASDNSGTGAEDVKAAATVAQAGASEKQVLINVHRDNDLADGKPYVRMSGTIGSTGGPVCALILGGEPRHAPVNHAASVVQDIN